MFGLRAIIIRISLLTTTCCCCHGFALLHHHQQHSATTMSRLRYSFTTTTTTTTQYHQYRRKAKPLHQGLIVGINSNKATSSSFYRPTNHHTTTTTTTTLQSHNNNNGNGNEIQQQPPPRLLQILTRYTPLWILFASLLGISQASLLHSTLGSLSVLQGSVAALMLSMGLAITPNDVTNAVKQPHLLVWNALLCFGLMPMVAMGLAKTICASSSSSSTTAGLVLLGSVSGGQASNLFTLLAGGDVAVSVICTLTTTLLGVVLTPWWIQRLLLVQTTTSTSFWAVVQSILSLVLVPLSVGLGVGRYASVHFMKKWIHPLCPVLGIGATLLLVAGGAANSAVVGMDGMSILLSGLLPLVGGGIALGLLSKLDETTKIKKALVVETLSKSPTLANVLAIKHFGMEAAMIPAAGMVTLAVLGALVASIWSTLDPE